MEGAAAARAAQLNEQIAQYQQQQHDLLGQIQAALREATQGHHLDASSPVHSQSVEQQIEALTLLTTTREHVVRLKTAAEAVKQLERQIRPATHVSEETQHTEELVQLAFSAAESYVQCAAEVAALTASLDRGNAAGGGGGGNDDDGGDGSGAAAAPPVVPEQLREVERQLQQRLQAAHDLLRGTLSNHAQRCLSQCGWPPPLVPSAAGAGAGAGAGGAAAAAAAAGPVLSGPDQTDALNALQRLMVAMTRLQLASQRPAIEAALQAGGTGSTAAVSDAPLLWIAEELAAPVERQLRGAFAGSAPGSPGALDAPELLLGTVHRLAADGVRRVEFLQAVVQALQLDGAYHVGVELTRALREALKRLLRDVKLPEVSAAAAAAHNPAGGELWLAWVDALVAFEAGLARSGLLGCAWDAAAEAGELPVLLLRGSALGVLAEEPAWLDAWLDAEASAAAAQVEAALYSAQAWGPGQSLVAEDDGRPPWLADLWPPRAAEDVAALVEALLARLRYVPTPDGQQRFLAGAVGAVLAQAHGRVQRLLQQADMFGDVTGYAWLPRVCTCVCFCHYIEAQLQDMRDDAQVLVTRLLEGQHQAAELAAKAAATGGAAGGAQQQQQRQASLDGGQQQQQQQQQQQDAANNNVSGAGAPPTAPVPWMPPPPQGAPQQQQQQQQQFPPSGPQQQQQQGGAGAAQQGQAEAERLAAAAAARLRALERPLADFSTCRREWVLKLGKAAAVGFVGHAAGYVSRGGAHFVRPQAGSGGGGEGGDAAAGMDGSGDDGGWAAAAAAGVVSGELQPALAWLAGLLDALGGHLDKDCFRAAWSAAAAAINRELFNGVACDAVFTDAGAAQLVADVHALLGVFGRFTPRPAAHFRELVDAARLLSLQRQQGEFVHQAVAAATRAPNAAEALRSVGVHSLDAELADAVLSLRVWGGGKQQQQQR